MCDYKTRDETDKEISNKVIDPAYTIFLKFSSYHFLLNYYLERYNNKEPGILYIVLIERKIPTGIELITEEKFIKIGYTKNGFNKRLKGLKHDFGRNIVLNVYDLISFERLDEAYAFEQFLHDILNRQNLTRKTYKKNGGESKECYRCKDYKLIKKIISYYLDSLKS